MRTHSVRKLVCLQWHMHIYCMGENWISWIDTHKRCVGENWISWFDTRTNVVWVRMGSSIAKVRVTVGWWWWVRIGSSVVKVKCDRWLQRFLFSSIFISIIHRAFVTTRRAAKALLGHHNHKNTHVLYSRAHASTHTQAHTFKHAHIYTHAHIPGVLAASSSTALAILISGQPPP